METPILFYSTNNKAKPLTFQRSLAARDLAPDKGLYMPEDDPGVYTKGD